MGIGSIFRVNKLQYYTWDGLATWHIHCFTSIPVGRGWCLDRKPVYDTWLPFVKAVWIVMPFCNWNTHIPRNPAWPFITFCEKNSGSKLSLITKCVRWENFGGWNHYTGGDAVKTMHLCKERLSKYEVSGMWLKQGTFGVKRPLNLSRPWWILPAIDKSAFDMKNVLKQKRKR